MKNSIDYLFDSAKFAAVLADVENQRVSKSAVFNQNSQDNKSSRKTFMFGFMGIWGCSFVLIPFIFFGIIVMLFSDSLGGMLGFTFRGIVFFVLALFVLVVVLIVINLQKSGKKIIKTDRDNFAITKEYRLLVKEKLIKEIVQSFNATFDYFPNKCISENRFYDMQLYSNSYGFSNYKGEDYIVGKVGTTTIEMCEFSIGKVAGLFMIAEFNKSFKGVTKVLIKTTKEYKLDASDILEGEIGLSIEGNYADFVKKRDHYNNTKLETVLLEDPIFSQQFDVYSSDQIEARYILSNSLMERILAFKSRYNYDMNFVFQDSKLYFTINWGANMLEPYNINVSVQERKMDLIENTHAELGHCISLIEALNMNSALWYAR